MFYEKNWVQIGRIPLIYLFFTLKDKIKGIPQQDTDYDVFHWHSIESGIKTYFSSPYCNRSMIASNFVTDSSEEKVQRSSIFYGKI